MAKARPLARKAMELAPDLAAPHSTIGMIRAYADWDWDGAERDFKRAILLDPGYAWAHSQYGRLLGEAGRFEEALVHLERAAELEPLTYDPAGTDVGRIHDLMGNEEQAVVSWKERIEISPGHYAPQLRLGDYYCRIGRYEEAIPLLERAQELNRLDPWVLAVRGYCHAISGKRAAAEEVLKELEAIDASGYVTPMAFALIDVGLGNHERAFDWLERAHDARALRMLPLNVDQRFDPIREDARFVDLLQRVGGGKAKAAERL